MNARLWLPICGVAGVVIALLAVQQSFFTTTPKPVAMKTITLKSETVRSLYNLFNSHEVRADFQKTDKYLLITGKVSKIFKEEHSGCVLFDLNLGNGVRCYFSVDDLKSVADLDIGQPVTIVGHCHGRRVKHSMQYTDVVLNKCLVVSTTEELPEATVKVPQTYVK